MALSQFMPYGAPELLEDQDARLAKATLTSMVLLGILFAVVGSIAALAPHPRAFTLPPLAPPIWLQPPPSEPTPPKYQVQQPATAPAHADPHAVPVPVEDKQALVELPVANNPVPPGPVASSPGRPDVLPDGMGVEDGAPPEPGTFVYTDELPELIRCAPIVYPDFARDAGVEGRVVILVLVGKDGRVRDARVEAKHSVPMLDAAALESARTCVFKPALANGHPVAVWIARPYEFRLH